MSIINFFAKNLMLNYFDIMNQILKYLTRNYNKSFIFKNKSKLYLVKYLNFD